MTGSVSSWCGCACEQLEGGFGGFELFFAAEVAVFDDEATGLG
jgi:hypothetical protein